MINVELTTRIGTFKFKLLDKTILKKYKGFEYFKFKTLDGKNITLFGDIIKSSKMSYRYEN